MDSTETTDKSSCTPCGGGWKLPIFLAMLLFAILLVRFARTQSGGERVIEGPPPAADAPATATQTVSLAIDFGKGPPLAFGGVPWHKGMTIEDLFAAVSQSPGSPEFARQGARESAFLTRISSVANEGAQGRNWTYQVNDRSGDRSFAIYELEPGDRVLWRFGPSQ